MSCPFPRGDNSDFNQRDCINKIFLKLFFSQVDDLAHVPFVFSSFHKLHTVICIKEEDHETYFFLLVFPC